MKCIYCGGLVLWKFPIIDGVSKCEECGEENCHENEIDDDLEELDE